MMAEADLWALAVAYTLLIGLMIWWAWHYRSGLIELEARLAAAEGALGADLALGELPATGDDGEA